MNFDSAFLRPGVRLSGTGATFVIRAAQARSVDLLLFDGAEAAAPRSEKALERVSGTTDLWRVEVPGIRAGQLYVYRIRSAVDTPAGDGWILDPCARAVTFSGRRWGEREGWVSGHIPRDGARFPKAAVVDDKAFNWGSDALPRTPWSDTVLYEIHVRGFTQGAGSGVRHPGTYEGLVERIPYLQELGVTAVELMPVHEFDELEFFLEGRARRNLLNYWGYDPLAFQAPMSRYAADPDPVAAVHSFKNLVKALHKAGIEVLLDVVFNHTGEGNEKGPVYHFKRLDPAAYYLLKKGGNSFLDVTGCGNTVNANRLEAMELIVDSLCVWAEHMHVDGFRFDLAAALARGPDGRILENPPLFERLAAEPRLRGLKFIAEPWDMAGRHPAGRFPVSSWAEWNDRFRDDLRKFWAGYPGLLGVFATRLAGNSDLFEPASRSPLRSLNYLACHDGFPLGDLVRYAHKHNEANREKNRDGANASFSVNYGVEGETDDPAIEAKREVHLKTLFASLFLAQGVPMFTAGDEFARTQQGNNNAYPQDNEISWIDWNLLSRYGGLQVFVRRLIAFRRAHRSLRRDRVFRGVTEDGAPADIEWFGPGGHPPDWAGGAALACRIDGGAERTGADRDEPSLFLAFNAGSEPVEFQLPDEPAGWRSAWATQEPGPDLPGPGEPWVIPAPCVAALESGT